jgi:hypothetical protein
MLKSFPAATVMLLEENDIRNYINGMKARQASVAGFMEKNYTLEQIKSEFSESEAALTETIYNENIRGVVIYFIFLDLHFVSIFNP